MTFIRTCRVLLAAAAGMAMLPGAAFAQAFPSKTLTLIVPFAAGGGSDTLARLLAEHLGRTLGQQVIVENVGGAGGTLGAERAARAAPDGYTIFQHHSGLPASKALYANIKYDPATSFEALGLMNTGPMVLTSRKTLATNTARQLLDHVKANGDKVTVAHAGPGSNSYMCALLIIQATGVKPALVPYRGAGPAMNDLVGGQIDILCDQATTASPQVLAGTVKGYVVTSQERLAALPEVPSAKDAGLANFEMAIWNGFYAPKGTPKPIQETLHNALQKFLDDPRINERFAQGGTVAFAANMRSPAAHQKFLEAEIERYLAMAKSAGLRPEVAK